MCARETEMIGGEYERNDLNRKEDGQRRVVVEHSEREQTFIRTVRAARSVIITL